MNIAIVDDHPAERTTISSYITRYLDASMISAEVTYYESGEQFLDNTDLSNLDAAFLDIFLGGMTGIELAERIRLKNSKCMIVLSSVSKDFIHDSYDVGAKYYLIKPYAYEVFEKAMNLVTKNVNQASLYIEITSNRKRVRINLDDIFYVDLNKHYVQFHLFDSVFDTYKLTFNDTQKALLKFPNFLNCFHYVIVNMKHIREMDGRDFIMTNGERVPINRRQNSKIRDAYVNYTFDNMFGEKQPCLCDTSRYT